MSNSKPTWELCHPHVLWCILSSVPQFAPKWPFTESSSPIGRSFGIGPFSLNGRHFKTKKDTWHPPVPKFSHFKGISSSHCWTNLAHFPTHFHALRGNYSGSNQAGRKLGEMCYPDAYSKLACGFFHCPCLCHCSFLVVKKLVYKIV